MMPFMPIELPSACANDATLEPGPAGQTSALQVDVACAASLRGFARRKPLAI